MKKILVIEDENSLREDIIEILTYENFEVLGAENGTQGLSMAKKHLPDLILCDIMMPDIDGYGVLLELRSTPQTVNIPLIFLTAKTSRADMRQGMELGADDYVTKPFTQPELLAAIQTRLRKQAQLTLEYERRLETLRDNVIHALPHEFRTPLTGILGYTHMLIEEANNLTPKQILQMAQGIEKSTRRVHRLAENYLLYAQLEILSMDTQRRAALRSEKMEITETMLRDIATKKAKEYDRSGDLQINAQTANVAIVGENLEKILSELLDNAFKFSSSGSSVTVDALPVDGFFSLRIGNRGRGMTAEQINSVGAYMQFDRRIYEQRGLGLGLVIAQRLAELHQGELSIASVPEQQTSVTVRLQLAD